MKRKLSLASMFVFILGTIFIQVGIMRTRDFSNSAAISMPSRLAAQLRLIRDGDAIWGGSDVAFRPSANGGYEYSQIGGISLFDYVHHTSLDIDAECVKARSCRFLSNGEFEPRQ